MSDLEFTHEEKIALKMALNAAIKKAEKEKQIEQQLGVANYFKKQHQGLETAYQKLNKYYLDC